jgi:hypothetical protein
MTRRALFSIGVLLASSLLASRAAADTQACVDASQKGQEARDSGKLLESRPYFTTCADPSCPNPVPTYCLDWMKDVNRRIPSLVFRVTDAAGNDLVDVRAKIDGVTVASALDGRPVEVNPGSHVVAFDRGSVHTEQTLLVVESEKGRVLTAKLDIGGSPPAAAASVPGSEAATPPSGTPARPVPIASWVAWGVGAAALVGFGVFGLEAKSDFDSFKSSCGSRCTNADRDSVKTTVLLADVFLAVGIVAVGVGTVFYLTRPAAERRVGALPAALLTNGIRW